MPWILKRRYARDRAPVASAVTRCLARLWCGRLLTASLFAAGVVLSAATEEAPVSPEANGTDLRDQLQQLSTAAKFRVHGLERVTGEPMRAVAHSKPAIEVLKVVLDGFDYVVVNDPRGAIAEVRILGRSNPAVTSGRPRHTTVQTTKNGNHQELVAVLIGPNGMMIKSNLVLDTGATTVVLPISVMDDLGFEASTVRAGWADTAGGRVRIWSGVLGSLAVGTAKASDVAVSFIDDNQLGDRGLLGMSFLSRFKVIVDDAKNEVVFVAR